MSGVRREASLCRSESRPEGCQEKGPAIVQDAKKPCENCFHNVSLFQFVKVCPGSWCA